MANLKEYKLGNIANIVVSNVDKKTTPNQKTVKLCNFVDVYYNWAITKSNYDSFMTATASDEEISKFSLKKGQVAFTKDSETRDDIGIPAYIAEDFKDVVLGYHTALATPDENIVTGEYLNAFMHSSYIQKYFELNATGSGMRYTLSQQTLHDIPILAPDLDAQHKIGSLLSKIDRKISINREINRNLEELAKQIYDYWFVQFDFPNEEGKPYKSSGGKMVWNDVLKREIPDGWEVKKIEDFCRIFTGKKDVNQSLDFGKYKFFSCAPGYRFSNEKLYEGKAILISGNGSYTGRTIFVNDAFDLYQRTYAVVLKTDNTDCLEYIFYTAKRFLSLKVGGGTHGSAIPYIVYDDIAKECFPFCEIAIEKFQKLIVQILSRISRIEKEILELSNLRDNLLPLLMNGQVTLNSCLSAHGILLFVKFTIWEVKEYVTWMLKCRYYKVFNHNFVNLWTMNR